ncbi:hypothetical protein HYG87_08560 [Methanobacterium alkalithermotolerans]|uniref:Uncharacterized protein n=1 Tax=Methanobacterium alkalithermotolerans TaxID=2731220 RepID=A0A8T8K8B1_9EURY|nr:hypothetical protein [Methanobacterium alkalithermotolerans]QUH23805.1 hypothetical protein HYG87_08560 [Methanobacterium alkalithermotolerans]
MLTGKEALELQEKLIIIYKYISQERLMKKFYLDGLEDSLTSPKMDSNLLVKKLIQKEDAPEILKESILALEEIKARFNISEKATDFENIINQENLDYLCRRYGLKDCREIEKLDLSKLINAI